MAEAIPLPTAKVWSRSHALMPTTHKDNADAWNDDDLIQAFNKQIEQHNNPEAIKDREPQDHDQQETKPQEEQKVQTQETFPAATTPFPQYYPFAPQACIFHLLLFIPLACRCNNFLIQNRFHCSASACTTNTR